MEYKYQNEPEEVSWGTWAVIILSLVFMMCIAGFMLCACTAKFTSDTAFLPNISSDIQEQTNK